VPDPTRPPLAGKTLTPDQADAARLAVGLAEAGDFTGAAAAARAIPPGHPVGALVALEVSFLRGEPVAAGALALARTNPGYASAWAFLALAARGEGDARGALVAARTAAGLQPDAGWDRMASEIEAGIVGGLLAEGQARLDAGDPQGALDRAQDASRIAPENGAARLLSVRAFLAQGDAHRAAELVPALPDSGDGLELKGRVAEALGQWDLAAEFFGRLPASYPHRCELLAEARQRARFADAPPYLRKAMGESPLNRKGLAAIIAWEVPSLAASAGGAVPVLEDVVQLPEGRDIVTVARAGVMPGDPIARRFAPERTVTPRELATALERLAKVLGKPAPVWCGADEHGCRRLPELVDGESAAELVLDVAGQGGEPCPHR